MTSGRPGSLSAAVRCRLLALLILTLGWTGQLSAALGLHGLHCEGVDKPGQVDTARPRFSWRLDNPANGVTQLAYQFRASEIDGAGKPLGQVYETARIPSEQSLWVTPPGFEVKARRTYQWQVRVWDNQGGDSGWSSPESFGTGLLGEQWPADWIGDGRFLERFHTAPARHFRSEFKAAQRPVRARLYVSAMGLVEPWLNSHRVTEDLFVPGWPDYRRRVFYAAYDVSALVHEGENALGLVLGDGWYSGTMIPRHQYGPEATCSAFLDLSYADGSVVTLTTGEGWRWTDTGPITMNSIYDGETYDARRELAGWSEPGLPASPDWRPVTIRSGRFTPAAFTGRQSPPVRRIQTLKPVSVRQLAPGTWLYDLGQNMVGWVRLRLREQPGRELQLRFVEMLNPDGTPFTANLRKAKATARYTARGGDSELWEPRFTYFGFRYVELSGTETPLPDAVEGVVIHSDLPRIGSFSCSDELLNQLWRNALWSQKGNFLELPTDCPQRDERAGWTGDAQIFAQTALCNMDAGPFYRQWLNSLRDGLWDDPRGGFPDVAPFTGFGHGSPGWAEAGFIIPWQLWLHTGDRQVLAESLPAAQHALELMAAQAPDGLRQCPPSWGDWLAPGFPKYKSPPRQDLIATAFLAHAAELAARMAEALGRPELAASDRALRDKARNAYSKAFVSGDGRVADDVQTSYLLTLAYDLAPQELQPKVANQLLRTLAEKDHHLATGFIGTPLLAPVLSRIGHADEAYRVLLQTSYPGWLFTVRNGATTIWERWDSWTPDQGFNKDGMNSFNHYSYGSIVGWFYTDIAGLQPLSEAPGWKRFRIAPTPGGGLTQASAAIETPYGHAVSSWWLKTDEMRMELVIPPNSSAEVLLPTQATDRILLDGVALEPGRLRSLLHNGTQRPALSLPSGRYTLSFKTSLP